MSDEQAPATEQVEEPTQEETGGIDWKKRYEDLRPQYDRVQNEYSRYQDPEYRQQLFTELAEEQGYALPGPDELYEDPTEQLRAELRAELQQELSKRDQADLHKQAVLYAQDYADAKLDEIGVDKKQYGEDADKIREWIETKATAMPALQDEHGFVVPDIEAAYEEYKALVNAEKKRWGNTKTGVVAASEGQANTGVPSWKNEQDPDKRREMRNAWAQEQLELRRQAHLQ
jgi:hypothetical protein